MTCNYNALEFARCNFECTDHLAEHNLVSTQLLKVVSQILGGGY